MPTTYSIATAPVSPTLTTVTNGRTFPWTPKKVNNLIYLCVAWRASTLTINTLSDSANEISWLFAGSSTPDVQSGFGGNTWAFQQYVGIPAGTSATTVTFKLSGSITAIQIDAVEITADSVTRSNGFWEWYEGKNSAATGTTLTWPTLNNVSLDDMYLGYAFAGATPTYHTGTPAGFTYVATAGNDNEFAYNLAYGGGTSVPTGTQSSSQAWYTAGLTPVLLPLWTPGNIDMGAMI